MPNTLLLRATFQRKLTLPDGQVLTREFKRGDAMWSPTLTHVGENVGTTPTHVIIVEFKLEAAGFAACSAR